MGGHLVLAGGGHAHLTTIASIGDLVARGHKVTVLGPSPYHYYSGMAPGALAGTYRPREIRFNIQKTVTQRGGTFVQDKVIAVDPNRRELMLDSGGGVSYDVVSFNLGSRVASGTIYAGNRFVFPAKPIINIIRARQAIKRLLEENGSPSLFVVGGGPAGVEMAAALTAMGETLGASLEVGLVTGSTILKGFPEKAVELARSSLSRRGVTIRENTPVAAIGEQAIELADRTSLDADIVLLAVGVKPTPLFLNSLVPTGEDGGLLVDNQLKSVEFENIFGGGDCITLRGQKLDRVGVYAVRQNPVLAHNLLATLEGTPLNEFDPGSPNYIQILNMCDGTAIFRKGNLVRSGKAAYRLKDWIDRRFMRKYQLSGEQSEPD
jgi:NADH dehydrogenase FAD-containing subunit